MSERHFRKLTGIFFIIGAILINVPYTLLIVNFDYPDILRQPTAEILTKFHASGDSLIYTWLAFAWVGLPILLGTVMLKGVLEKEASPFLETATTLGVIYIMVGHSMGGMLVSIFADQHPGEVAGVVLVDSAHPDMGDRLMTCLPPESADGPEKIRFFRQWFTYMSDSSHKSPFTDIDSEVQNTLVSNQQVREVESLGDLPLVVISQAPNIPGLGYQIVASSEIDACLRQIWQDMQGELAGLSSNSSRLTARGGHGIPVEHPELIVQASPT